jgi:tape measure domain-containing protein
MKDYGPFATASVQIRADFDRYNKAMKDAKLKTEKSTDKMSSSFANVGKSMLAAGGIVAALGLVTKGLRAIADAGEQRRLLEDRFRAITGSATRAASAIDLVLASALRTGDTVQLVGDLVTRFTLAADAIGASDVEVVRFTESLIKLGRIGGASSESVKAATVQLSQALAGGVVRAEEFNSVIENTPFIAKALADSLGIGLGQLRAMVLDGQLLSDTVFEAILSQTARIDAQFAQMESTREQAMTRLGIAAGSVLQELDKNLAVSRTWVGVLERAASVLESIGAEMKENGARVAKFQKFADEQRIALLEERITSTRVNVEKYAANPGRYDPSNLTAAQDKLRAYTEERRMLQQRHGLGAFEPARENPHPSNFATTKRTKPIKEGELGPFGGDGGFVPVSSPTWADQLTESTTSASGGSAATDEIQRTTDRLVQMTQALRDQEGQLGLTGTELATYRATTEANNATKEALIGATEEEKVLLQDLAALYVGVSVRMEESTAAQQRQTDALDEAKRAGEESKRAMGDTISTMVRGVQSANSFSEALQNVALSLLEVVLKGALLGEGPASGLGSLLTSAAVGLAGAFAGGAASGVAGTQFSSGQLAKQYASYGMGKRATGGPVQAGVPHMVNENTARSEVFVPSTSGAVLTSAQAERALASGAGGGSSKGAAFSPVFKIDINQAMPGVQDLITSAIQRSLGGADFKNALERFRGRRG